MSIAIPSGTILSIPPSAVRLATATDLPLHARLQPPPPVGGIIADNHPSNIYATLQRNGQTIATVYKSGGMMTPNAVGLPPDLAHDGHGLPLAELRLQQMRQLHGGTVHYAQPQPAAKSQAAPPPPERASTLFAAQLARLNF